MINYELAKKLKEAGFPQDCSFQYEKDTMVYGRRFTGHNLFHKSVDRAEGDEAVDCPTLSELIEACGEGFETLSRFEGKFYCHLPKKEAYAQQFKGNTPEEAVAFLYLALNKKA